MFCGLARKARLKWRLRAPPCNVWSCEIRPRRFRSSRGQTIPALIAISKPRLRPFDVQGPTRAEICEYLFFFSSGTCVRGRAVTARAYDLCMRVKSRVATSGKRNWSRYASCEKATEINGHARVRGARTSMAKLRWACSRIRDCNRKNRRRWSRVSKSNRCET